MDTLERLRRLAAKELAIDPGALDPAAPLDSLGIDSLSFIDFMFKVEEEFGVRVTDDELKDIKTLAALERCVAITGAGVVSPIGRGFEAFSRALAGAVSGIGLLPEEIAGRSGVQVGAL